MFLYIAYRINHVMLLKNFTLKISKEINHFWVMTRKKKLLLSHNSRHLLVFSDKNTTKEVVLL